MQFSTQSGTERQYESLRCMVALGQISRLGWKINKDEPMIKSFKILIFLTFSIIFFSCDVLTLFQDDDEPFTPEPEVELEAPNQLAIDLYTATSVVLTWIDMSDNEEGFSIEQSYDGTFFSEVGTVSSNIETITINSLTANHQYYFRIKAFNSDSESDYSAIVSVTTLSETSNEISTPENLAISSITTSSAVLIWDDMSDNEEGFSIEQSYDGTFFSEVETVSSNIETITINSLTANHQYYFRIKAFNSDSESDYSAIVSVTTLSETSNEISTPENLAISSITTSSAVLIWDDMSDNEEGFSIEQSYDGTFFSEVETVSSNIETITINSLTANHQYYFRIKAFNSDSESDYSNSVQLTTLPQTLVDITPPVSTEKLIFIHHSCGDNWLSNSNGDLGNSLGSSNYYVRDIYYGWDAPYNDNIGDRTDTINWPTWFASETLQGNGETQTNNIMNSVYTSNSQYSSYTSISDPGGENSIIMFKSCYPNSEVGSSIDDEKAIYNSLLPYFASHTEKLFILITPPGETDVTSYILTKELNQWLVNMDTGWLSSYSEKNVAVFDFYCVLSENDSHHTVENDEIVYIYSDDYDGKSPYHNNYDDHPNNIGNQKSSAELLPLLNYFYNRWKNN
ncbi:fibronectin type III domain-containing protein [Spirochaeta isovalerica]|uniref:Fibronectin type-III domain-containing protein n=1 Tax=Spirochaeta isovalerica TaxID=150 RepID=A0A841R8I1_9SPIO|nr:fibronectin type III domain-containing protein [Spirochaeta isovalerica]MBB6479269.1 hypothetical protein [Spirochaeta isovalerica]